MSVLLETSLGDIVIDLEVEACPKTCENFLKLCKVYYYNLHAFFNGRSHALWPKSCVLTLLWLQYLNSMSITADIFKAHVASCKKRTVSLRSSIRVQVGTSLHPVVQ